MIARRLFFIGWDDEQRKYPADDEVIGLTIQRLVSRQVTYSEQRRPTHYDASGQKTRKHTRQATASNAALRQERQCRFQARLSHKSPASSLEAISDFDARQPDSGSVSGPGVRTSGVGEG